MEQSVIGLTVWRSRPTVKGDQTKELIEEEAADGSRQSVERTWERLAADTPLVPGEKLRLGIESVSHEGYLYIVNREKYADGTFGQANLIFPSLRTKNGENFVRPGNLTFIPPPPRFLRVEPKNSSGKKMLGEEVIFIISPVEIIDRSLFDVKPLQLTAEQVSGWENK